MTDHGGAASPRTEDLFEDSIRAYVEDFIGYGVETGKFASPEDAPDIDAWLETLTDDDWEPGIGSAQIKADSDAQDVLPQDRAVKIEGAEFLRRRHG